MTEAQKANASVHTFTELYEHRAKLYIALCKVVNFSPQHQRSAKFVWRSKAHSDGSVLEGWFLLGIDFRKGEQITYHLPIQEWESCWFARDLDKAPAYDGHTSKDVIDRLRII